MQEHEYEVSMVLSNTRDTPITLIVEPWGALYEMVPQEKYLLCFRSPFPPSSPQAVEIEYALDGFTVYAWDGCLFALYHHGEVLSPGGAFAGPRVPGGIEILKKIGFLKQTMHAALAREKPKDVS
jgi:hypothetical protein